MSRMSTRFRDSAADIKDALVKEGYILCVKKVLQKNGKYAYHHQLTGKPFVSQKHQEMYVVKQDQLTDLNSWEDGTAKSTGNAFDWRSKNQGIFTKAQIAQMQQKQVGKSFPITTFSRA
jgi:hypothetical protein